MPDVIFTGTGSPLRRMLAATQRLFDADATGSKDAFEDAMLELHREFEGLKAYLSERDGKVEGRS